MGDEHWVWGEGEKWQRGKEEGEERDRAREGGVRNDSLRDMMKPRD